MSGIAPPAAVAPANVVAPPVFPTPSPAGMGAGALPPPSLFPGVEPTPGAKTPAAPDLQPPKFDPPAPSPAPSGGPTMYIKPAGMPEAKPIAPEQAPKTTFDVDVYESKDGDSYETVSQEFYNDKRFAQALRAFNKNQPLQGGRYVNVPPIHVLKRQFPGQVGGGVVPVGGSRPAPAATTDAPDWSATPATRGGASTVRTPFVVPRGNGMTLRQVARQAMGTEQRWQDIYYLNPQVTKADEVLPAGTELKLPADARLP